MQRVTRSSRYTSLPAAPASPATPGYFGPGDPFTGAGATVPGYEWFNAVQESLIAGLIEHAGLAASQTDFMVLRQALRRLYGGNVTSLAADTTLTFDHAGLVVVDASYGNRTLTLPQANSLSARPISFQIVRSDATANTVTVQCAGSDLIDGAASLTLAGDARVSLQSDGWARWMLLSGRESAAGSIYAASGRCPLPNGGLLQWGSATGPATGTTNSAVGITFPRAFPAGCYAVMANANGSATAAGWPPFCIAMNITATGFTLGWDILGGGGTQTITIAPTARWMAIGK